MDNTLSLLIRSNILLKIRPALRTTFQYIKQFENLSNEIRDKVDSSLDLAHGCEGDKKNIEYLTDRVQSLLCVAPLAVSQIKTLKDEFRLFSMYFVFRKRDYLRYLEKEMGELRKLLSVFDVEMPPLRFEP